MLLNKNQIEAVRYQVKKLNSSCTNDEIRNCAANYKDFDAVLIAQSIVNNKTNSLTINESEITTPANTNQTEESNMLALLDNQETTNTSNLTTTQKHALIQIKSQELGIDLSVSEITKISDMVGEQINDSINFLNEVGSIIQEFFTNRNNQVKDIVNQKVNDIAQIINTKNDELGDIFNGANQRLIDIASECSQQKTDYKSTYKTKLESIREILKLPA